jgi:hypothetical protein
MSLIHAELVRAARLLVMVKLPQIINALIPLPAQVMSSAQELVNLVLLTNIQQLVKHSWLPLPNKISDVPPQLHHNPQSKTCVLLKLIALLLILMPPTLPAVLSITLVLQKISQIQAKTPVELVSTVPTWVLSRPLLISAFHPPNATQQQLTEKELSHAQPLCQKQLAVIQRTSLALHAQPRERLARSLIPLVRTTPKTSVFPQLPALVMSNAVSVNHATTPRLPTKPLLTLAVMAIHVLLKLE